MTLDELKLKLILLGFEEDRDYLDQGTLYYSMENISLHVGIDVHNHYSNRIINVFQTTANHEFGIDETEKALHTAIKLLKESE
jgi:hypothetical protein